MGTTKNTRDLSHGNRTLAVLLLAVGQTVVWATLFYVFPAMILQWKVAHGWSLTQITGALTIALLLSAVCSPIVGRLIDKGVGPFVLSGGAAFGGVLLYLLSAANFLWQFYLLWALIGIAMASCLYEPCFMLVTRAYGSSAKRSIITITLVAGFASTISFPLSHFIAETAGWRAVAAYFSIAALLIGVPTLYIGASILEKHASSRNIEQGGEKFSLQKNPQVLRLGLCFSLLAIVHGATLHHLLPVLNDRGISAVNAVLVASLIGPMQVVGRLVMTVFQQRVTHSVIAHSCFVFIGMSMCLLYFSDAGFAVAVGFACAFGGSYGVVSIIRPVIARDILGESGFGAKSGVLAFYYLIGSALSPYLGSLLWTLGGYDLMIPVAAGLSVFGLILLRRALLLSV